MCPWCRLPSWTGNFLAGRGKVLWAERDRRLEAAREVRRVRRAEVHQTAACPLAFPIQLPYHSTRAVPFTPNRYTSKAVYGVHWVQIFCDGVNMFDYIGLAVEMPLSGSVAKA